MGPITRQTLNLYAAPGSPIVIHALKEARPYRVGTLLGSVATKTLVAAGVSPQETAGARQNYQKLLMGRIDLWASNSLALSVVLEAGEAPRKLVYEIARNDTYMACHQSVADATIIRLQHGLDHAKAAGKIKLLGF